MTCDAAGASVAVAVVVGVDVVAVVVAVAGVVVVDGVQVLLVAAVSDGCGRWLFQLLQYCSYCCWIGYYD